MSKPSTPAISSKTYNVDEATMYASSKDLYADAELDIIVGEGKEKKTFNLPLNLLPGLLQKGNLMLTELKAAKIIAQKDLYHPASRFDFLVPMSKNSNKDFYLLQGEDPLVEGTPYLQWVVPKADEKNLEPGWKVSFVGAADIKVQFARWDDKEGIERLANSLKNKEQLLTTLAFIHPESTAKLASRKAVTELKNTRSLPAVKMTEIRRMIKNLELDTNPADNSYSAHGTLTSLFLKVGNVRTPVAIRVDPSNSPRWKKKIPALTTAEQMKLSKEENKAYQIQRNADLAANKEETKEEWIRRFRLGVSENTKMVGWRFVSIPNTEYSYTTEKQPDGIWLTRIPEKTWELIAPAAHATARSTHMRGSKF